MAKVFGRATIEINGQLLDSNKGASLDVGGVKRTSKMTAKGRAGAQEEQMPARIECSFPLIPGIRLKDLQALTDVTTKFRADTGQLYSIAHSDWIDPPKTDDQSGDVTCVIEGDAAEEIASG